MTRTPSFSPAARPASAAAREFASRLDPVQAVAALALPGQVLQGLFYLAARPWGIFSAAGLLLAVAGGWLVRRMWRGETRWAGWGLAALLAVQAIVLIAFLGRDGYQAQPPRGLLRWLVAGCLLDFLGLAVLAVVLRVTRVLPARGLLAVGSVMLTLWSSEGVLAVFRGRALAVAAMPFSAARENLGMGAGVIAPPGFLFNEIPSLPMVGGQFYKELGIGWRCVPGSTFDADYPSNPRGYFVDRPVFGELDPRLWAVVRETYQGLPPSSPRVEERRLRWDTRPWNSWAGVSVGLRYTGFPIRAGVAVRLRCRLRAGAPTSVVARITTGRPPFHILAEGVAAGLDSRWQEREWTLESHREDARGALQLGFTSREGNEIELEWARVETSDLADAALRHHTVRFEFNSEGFRDRERSRTRAPGVWRIVCLGDSYTEGVGVHADQIVTQQLESILNAPGRERPGLRYEVLNWGHRGFDTAQESLVYERWGPLYQPQVVLLMMVENDDLGSREEGPGGMAGWLRWLGRAFSVAELAEEAQLRHAAHDYGFCERHAGALLEHCREQGAELAVVVFRHDRRSDWQELLQVMRRWAASKDVPLIDLGESLLARFGSQPLNVHPIDEHPNEIAHRGAAEALAPFLAGHGLLGPDPPRVPPLDVPE